MTKASKKKIVPITIAVSVLVGVSWYLMEFREFAGSLLIEVVGGILIYFALDIYWTKHREQAQDRDQWSYQLLIKQVETSKRHLIIYTTYSYLFDPEHIARVDNNDKQIIEQPGMLWDSFYQALKSKLQNKASYKVKVVLLDPGTQAASQRQDERLSPEAKDDVIGGMYRNLRQLSAQLDDHKALAKFKRRFEVFVVSTMPLFQMHQVDEDLTVSFYSKGVAASQSRSILSLELDSAAGQFFNDEFLDYMVENSDKCISLDEFMYTKMYAINESGDSAQQVMPDKIPYISVEGWGLCLAIQKHENLLFETATRENFNYSTTVNNNVYTCCEKISPADRAMTQRDHNNQPIYLDKMLKLKYGHSDFECYYLSRPSRVRKFDA